VSLDAVGKDWIGSYGVATKVMCDTARMKLLTPQSFGIAVVHPRIAAFDAAQNGTDFGTLFLALGFFIIVAAILLMQNPLSEMYQLRRPEIQLLNALGFSKRQVFRRLFSEAVPVVLVSAPIGVLLGYAYAAVILQLLAGPWSGVVHTDGFALHANIMTVVLSFILSVILAFVVLALTVRGGQKSKGERQKAKVKRQRAKGNDVHCAPQLPMTRRKKRSCAVLRAARDREHARRSGLPRRCRDLVSGIRRFACS
jgi:polyferredoxin